MILFRPAFLAAISLCLIAILGLTRVYEQLPPQAVGMTVIGGTSIILLLHRFLPTFRKSLDALSLEHLICIHSIRAPIGAAFLIMSQEGLFPPLFANRAGYGDLFTALSGLTVVGFATILKKTRSRRALYLIWNIIGLVDLLIALGTGIYLATNQSDSMVWISRLPLLVVPTFILPVLFATHFLMLGRILKKQTASPSDTSI